MNRHTYTKSITVLVMIRHTYTVNTANPRYRRGVLGQTRSYYMAISSNYTLAGKESGVEGRKTEKYSGSIPGIRPHNACPDENTLSSRHPYFPKLHSPPNSFPSGCLLNISLPLLHHLVGWRFIHSLVLSRACLPNFCIKRTQDVTQLQIMLSYRF